MVILFTLIAFAVGIAAFVFDPKKKGNKVRKVTNNQAKKVAILYENGRKEIVTSQSMFGIIEHCMERKVRTVICDSKKVANSLRMFDLNVQLAAA